MLVLDLLTLYLRGHPYGVADSTAVQLRCTWTAYARHSGRAGLDALDADSVNDWLDQLRIDHAPDTVRTQRGNILVLWWYAFRERLVEEPPLRVRKLRPIRRSPTAWTLDEVRLLIAAAESFHTRRLWTGSLIRAGYDSGLRLGDLLALRRDAVAAVMRIRQAKTSRPVAVRLRPETLQAIEAHLAISPPDTLVWPLWGRREALYRHLRQVVAAAGIRPGTFRWLRRAAATQMERVEPGRGTDLLGHASRSTTEQWYLDRSQLENVPLPPW